MKTLGIAAHSAEGGALCFLTACRERAPRLGPHMHPTIVVSAAPMGLSMPGWETGDYPAVARFLAEGVQRVADAGADFYICPDNTTAHIVLEQIANDLPIPGLHIAEVVCHEITTQGWKYVGLLGAKWTMTGPVYSKALEKLKLERLIPDEPMRERLAAAGAIIPPIKQVARTNNKVILFMNVSLVGNLNRTTPMSRGLI